MPLAPSLPSSKAELHRLAAHVLVGTAGVAAALLLGTALVNELTGEVTRFSRLRGLYGAVLLLTALLGQRLVSRRPQLASAGVLGVAVLASWAHVVITGIGLHALVLTAALFAVTLSGVLCSVPTAVAFAAFNTVAALAVFAAERTGHLPGLVAARDLGLGERLLGQLIFTAVALMSAVLLARLLDSSLGRLIEHEQRLSELLGIGSDWTWEVDRSGRPTSISPSFEALTGRTVAEFLRAGQPGGPVPVDDEHWATVRADLKARRPYRDRLLGYRCTDGTVLWSLVSGNPLVDARGGFAGWRGVSRNVTAQQQALAAQQRTQGMLDQLVRVSPDVVLVCRLRDGVVLLVNDRFHQVTGYDGQEVIGRSAQQVGLVQGDDLPRRMAGRLRSEEALRDERVIIRLKDGRERALLMSGGTFDWDGEPVAVFSARDVTDVERARLEADAILDNASAGIALTRLQRIERANPALDAMLGRPRGSLAGLPARVLFRDDTQFEQFRAGLAGPLEQGRDVDTEYDFDRPDGSVVRVHLRARRVDVAHPESGTIWVVEDVTERRRSERELAAAKHQAESASQAKSAFLATMSHEIRTPLNGVLGLAQLMQDPQLDESRRREYLRHLVDAAQLLSGIVSDVLDLSKIEAGQMPIEAIGFDLHAMVHSSFSTFAPLGRERGLDMISRIDADVPLRVRGDPVRVRQIIANYLGNALKFTARGQIELRVRCPAPGRIRLEVHDTGPGIDDTMRAQLFRPFAQGDSSTTRRFGGTGLGLAICRELAERMGGEVGVDSDGHHGSCFWAEINLAAETRPALPGRDGGATLPLAGLQVLVAEDNAVNMLIVGAMLRRLGATVLEAEDGAQAVTLVETGGDDIHAVLMDLHMPVIDGLEATRRLRAGAWGQLPIYALSAAVLDQERQAATDAGMNAFIAKPVIEAELLRVLAPLVAGSGRPAAAPRGG